MQKGKDGWKTEKEQDSLFRQFIVFLVLLLLSMTIVLMFSQDSVRKIARQNGEQLNENSLIQLEKKIDEMLTSVQNMMSAVVYSPVTYDYYKNQETRPFQNADLRDVLVNATLTDDEIRSIELYDDRGILLMREGRKYKGNVSLEDVNTIVYSDRILSRQDGTIYYAVYFPIYDLKNVEYFSKLGVCVFYLSADRITRFLEEADMTAGTSLYVVDGEWDMLAQNENGKERTAFLDNPTEVWERYQTLNVKCSKNDWQILEYAPITGFFEGVEGQNSRVFILYFLFVGILGVLVLFCHRAVFEPIHRVAVFIKESPVYPGKRMEDSGKKNEIGILVGNLNRMLDERETMEREVQESQKRIYEEQLSRKQMEILAYRNQINPHFLYNTLECIRAMAVYQGCEDVGAVTVSLSNMLRYAVKGGNMVKIQEELEYVKEYGRIIECRFSRIRVLVESCEDLENYEMVRLTLQPLVENAVLHGLEPSLKGGFVKVSTAWEMEKSHGEGSTTGRIILRVEDNGCGMSKERLEQVQRSMKEEKIGGESGAQSIGLVNIYQRLRLIYGKQLDFRIDSWEGEGTAVEVRFPVNLISGKHWTNA